jgi:predicted PurR-regulated permease PerM
VLLAYVLDPLVTMVERLRFPRGYRLPRPAAAAAVMLAIVIGGAQITSWAAPRLLAELGGFIQGIPSNAERLLLEMRTRAQESGMSSYVDPAIQSVRAQLAGWLQGLGGAVIGWIGKLFGTLGKIIGLAVLPVLAYYLLAEREDVKSSFLSFIPETAHADFDTTLQAIDRALKSYVRGQALVSLIMGTTVGVALMLLGFPAVLLLGIIVGLAEVLPYIGFLLAAVAIALTGYGIDLVHALLGVVAYAIINTLIGVFVTPRVMARHLKMHPFVVTVSVLAGAELLGPAGAMLALPTAAVLQSLAEQYAPRRVVSARIATADDLAAGQS